VPWFHPFAYFDEVLVKAFLTVPGRLVPVRGAAPSGSLKKKARPGAEFGGDASLLQFPKNPGPASPGGIQDVHLA